MFPSVLMVSDRTTVYNKEPGAITEKQKKTKKNPETFIIVPSTKASWYWVGGGVSLWTGHQSTVGQKNKEKQHGGKSRNSSRDWQQQENSDELKALISSEKDNQTDEKSTTQSF